MTYNIEKSFDVNHDFSYLSELSKIDDGLQIIVVLEYFPFQLDSSGYDYSHFKIDKYWNKIMQYNIF